MTPEELKEALLQAAEICSTEYLSWWNPHALPSHEAYYAVREFEDECPPMLAGTDAAFFLLLVREAL